MSPAPGHIFPEAHPFIPIVGSPFSHLKNKPGPKITGPSASSLTLSRGRQDPSVLIIVRFISVYTDTTGIQVIFTFSDP